MNPYGSVYRRARLRLCAALDVPTVLEIEPHEEDALSIGESCLVQEGSADRERIVQAAS